MKSYTVTVHIAGKCIMEVEADNEEAAKQQAMDTTTSDDLHEWAPTGECEIKCDDDDEEDDE